MLKNYKENRVILLTTHFMDEADFLGDNIGIMQNGNLLCMGSPMFLKNNFGSGYNLTLVKQDDAETELIHSFIEKNIGEAPIINDTRREVSFQLKQELIDRFQGLLNAVDQNKEQLRISSYGVSITSLEDVFLRIQKSEEMNEKMNKNVDKLFF